MMNNVARPLAYLLLCFLAVIFTCADFLAQSRKKPQRKRVDPVPTQTPQAPPGRVNPLPQISPEEKAALEAKATLEKERLEMETLRASASAETRKLFLSYFQECSDGYYYTKGRQTYKSEDRVSIVPVYWFMKYHKISGFEGSEHSIRKLDEVDQLNNRGFEWEANYEIKASFFQNSIYKGGYTNIRSKNYDRGFDDLVMLVNYDVGRWSQWNASYSPILTIKLWRSANDEWIVKQLEFAEYPIIPEIADVFASTPRPDTLTYIRPTCEEIKRPSLVPDEILKVKREIVR